MGNPRLTNDDLLIAKRALNDFAMDKDQHPDHVSAAEAALKKVRAIIANREKTKTSKVTKPKAQKPKG